MQHPLQDEAAFHHRHEQDRRRRPQVRRRVDGGLRDLPSSFYFGSLCCGPRRWLRGRMLAFRPADLGLIPVKKIHSFFPHKFSASALGNTRLGHLAFLHLSHFLFKLLSQNASYTSLLRVQVLVLRSKQ